MQPSEPCLNDVVKQQAEEKGNGEFDRRTMKVDVGKLREWLASVSDYAEVEIHLEGWMGSRQIIEAHRGPKTNLHPHGTFILSVR